MEVTKMEQIEKSVSPLSNKNRNTYVINQITMAMIDLLEKKPIHEIPIRELCNKAEVGRTSFYRNFETKEDILKNHIEAMLKEWEEHIKGNTIKSLKEAIYQLFLHLEKNKEFYNLIYKRGLLYLMKDHILDLFGFNPKQELVKAYASSYVAFFIYGWIEVWFRRGMIDSPEEIASYLPEEIRHNS